MHQPQANPSNHLPATAVTHGSISSFIHSQDGLLLLDEELRVVEVNPAYLGFHQAVGGDLPHVNMLLQKSTLGESLQEFADKLSSLKDGIEENITFQVQDPQHASISYQVHMNNTMIDDGNRKGIAVLVQKMKPTTIQPMTHQSAEMFELLVQQSTDVFQLADAGFIISYTSKAVVDVLGFQPHHFIGRPVLDSIHPDDRDQVKEWMISIRSIREKLLTLEFRVKNKDGDWIWIENNARNMLHHPAVKAIVFTFRNIQAKKIADHALVQAEQRLSLLLNNTEESFIIINSRLRIITYNKAAQVHSPYFFTHELQSGMSVLDLVRKDEVEGYIRVFEEVFFGQEVEKETSWIDAKNISHIYNHTYRPLFDSHGEITGVFITSTNITERKKLTEELAENSERLQAAQAIARLAYFEYNFFTRDYFCSPRFGEILGLDELEQPLLEDIWMLERIVHPEDKEMLRSKLEGSIQGATDFNIEFRVPTANDKNKVILAIGKIEKNYSGIPQKLRVTIQDITDSKMSLLALQTLESKFRILFENSIDGVVLSSHDGQIFSANPSFCRMVGYTLDEIVTLNRSEMLALDSPVVKNMMEQRKKTGSYMGELQIRHKDGHTISAEVTSLSMYDSEGREYISSIVRDITEKKKIEQEQKALTEELLKNNQDLQQFSFITSHNLRAPVANLMSLLSLYNKDNPADEFNQVLIDKFGEATSQLNQTLNDLVNVLVIKSNNHIDKQLIRFSSVYTEVKRNIENLLEEQQGTIETDFSEVDEVLYKRIHIESIFLNMISNAIRYRSPLRRPHVKIRSYREANWAIVEFADNGLGMDLKRYGDRLFGLYQRFHENKEGKGLGLYMTRSQVLAMGGKIEVESEPGEGTTFKVYFKTG